jgi:hypothetical protein
MTGQRRQPIAAHLPTGYHFEYETSLDPFSVNETRRITRAQAGKVNVLGLSVAGADGTEIANAWACFGPCRCHGFSYPDMPLVISGVEVAAPYRHRGIATVMYCEIEAVMRRKLHPAIDQRTAGEEFWNRPNRPFGIADTTRRHHL